MPQHTPGPWRVTERDSGDNIFAGRRRIANTYGNHSDGGMNEANARLIAATPDLQSALILLVQELEMLYGKGTSCTAVKAAYAALVSAGYPLESLGLPLPAPQTEK